MNLIKKVLPIILLIVISCSTSDQSNTIMNTFFLKYQNDGVDIAVEYLFSTNKWIDSSQDDVSRIKLNLIESVEQFGEYYGYEHISTKSINSSLKQYTYLVKYDLQPLRFTITFYKPGSEWRVQNFKYDYKLIDELEEASRLYRDQN